ncbi:phosphoglucosamine mutase [Desulfosarcina alkanivorans]|uniref:Phosphoglucosamine mutase n=1 Tax=Desulfosarcina alkanivorans TaxID=571177 RepID=A0A5K7YDH2_9BACT|nr:phosphoglucosamine mutase [Desulfosarcina alkanivorans]BBO67026.1 phosphoglucosamine mutase [Desulfosarcina alkanivorans]
MGDLFGTDGIRGMANQYPLDCETALTAGRAIAAFFENTATGGSNRFVIGQDTRISGNMLVSALAAGICSMGKDVYLAGVIPTPAVAFLAAARGFDAGIVISASHNPYYDNGIKLFRRDGYKLSDEAEAGIEALIRNPGPLLAESAAIRQVGTVHHLDDARGQYRRFVGGCLSDGISLAGMKLVVDGSNGAASDIAPVLFRELGASVKTMGCSPDGININDGCGSQHPEALAERVVKDGAALGLAFDGDADRLIAVDEKGTVLSGDQVMAICARDMKEKGQLANPVVVTTVMSNLGFGAALKKMGIDHIQARVGDRYVMQEMVAADAVLGGEDSGHMIFLNHHTTGDGMLAALKLVEAMQSSGRPLSELSTVMTVFPQRLINVDVRAKPEIGTIGPVMQVIETVENQLGEQGRVLVRYSGTQPQCRVMVEGPTEQETNALCRQIARVVEQELGNG